MILSMTGYANTSADFAGGSLTLELRSVNHRYLDIQLRMPEELRNLESALREMIAAQLQRGKVECRINYSARETQGSTVLNQDLLQQMAVWNQQVQAALPDARTLSVVDVLRWNGMLKTPETASDELRTLLLDLMQKTLQEFTAFRSR